MKKRTTETVIHALKEGWIYRYGVPSRVHSDNAKEFLSNKFKQFMNEYGIEHTTSAPYVHRQNGGVERVFRWLRSQLKIVDLKRGSAKKWADQLGVLSYKHNTAYSRVLKTSPYKVMFGREPGDDCTGEENVLYRSRVSPVTPRQFKWNIGDRAIIDEPDETRDKASPNRDEVVEVVAMIGSGKVVVQGTLSHKERVVATSQLRRAYFL